MIPYSSRKLLSSTLVPIRLYVVSYVQSAKCNTDESVYFYWIVETVAVKTMNSNSANDASIESAVDDTNKSSIMINNNTTNAPAPTDSTGSLKEGDGTTTDAHEPNTRTTKIVEGSCDSQSVVQDASLPIPSQSVTSVDSTTEVDKATMIPPVATDGAHGLEPPNKRQRTNEETGAPVVTSNTDVSTAAAAAESKTATPTVPSSVSTGMKPNVNITNNHGHASLSSSTTQLLLPDYAAVRQTVQDLLALLQLYGPLTANQLEYNLPPVVAASIPWSVHDVLTILVAIGLVQHVKGTTDQYCMFGGIPRATAIYPTEIRSEIQRAIQEAEESYHRCQILQEALRCPTNTGTTTSSHHHNTSKNYLDVLKQLRHEYPQINNDPVYWTALRNCPLDHHHQMGGGTNVTVERRGHTATSKTKGSSKEGGGRSSKTNKGASTTEATGHSIISTEKKGVASLSSKVPPINSKSTESEATQRHATSIERESSLVSDEVEIMVDTTKSEPLAPEKTDTVAPITNDGLLPKSAVPTWNEDTVGASTTTTTAE